MKKFREKPEPLRAIVIDPDGKSYDIKPRNAYFTEEELREFFVGDFVIDLFCDLNVLIHDDSDEIDWDAIAEKHTPDFSSSGEEDDLDIALEVFFDSIASQGLDVNRIATKIKMHFEDKVVFPIVGRAIMCPLSLLDRCVLKFMLFEKYLKDAEFSKKVVMEHG